jgi:hypothetical protein
MKTISRVSTILSLAALAFSVGACGSGNSNNNNPAPPAAPGTVVNGNCVYTQVGLLPQGSCPAGQGQIITLTGGVGGYTVGQCLPQTTGAYGNQGYGYGNQGYGYGNQGYGYGNQGYGYGNTGAASPYAGGQCTGQTGVNGINNGQCIQTPSLGCLPQCTVPGSGLPGLQYNGNCAPSSTFGVYNTGVPGGVIPPYGNYGPYAPGYPGGYIPGGGGNFGGFYYRTF